MQAGGSPITSPNNAKIKLVRALHQRKYREEHGLVLVEGERLIRQSLEFGARFHFFLIDAQRLEDAFVADLRATGAEVVAVEPHLLAKAASTQSPQGVLGVAQAMSETAFSPWKASWLVIADALQDPGNLGTLQRVAAAVEVDGLALTVGTVDPKHPRAVRASAGAYFRVPLATHWEPGELASRLKTNGVRVVVADAEGEHDLFAYPWTGRIALVIGNEGSGPNPVFGEDRVRIPMPGGVESLNAGVAAGVILYQAWHTRSGRGAP